MVKKIGKLENLSELAKLELEEGETVVIDGIKNVRINIEEEVEKTARGRKDGSLIRIHPTLE